MFTVGLFTTALAVTYSASVATAASFDLATSLATKSSYWDQSKDPLGPSAFVKPVSPAEDAQYTLVHVQNVVRHGTRFPTKGNTVEIEDLLAKLQTNYNSVLPAWLQAYTLPYNVSIEGELAPAGTKETQALGARARTRIGAAVPATYSSDKFLVEHTYKPRTKDTAKAFAATFFSNPDNVVFVQHPKSSDLLFRFFDECPRYTTEVAENVTAMVERDAFKASPAYQKHIDTLRLALHLPADANLTTLDVESAFSACSFDLALYGSRDMWCSLLTDELVQSCEYAEDLETFVEHSAGAKITYEIAAVLLQDVYKSFTAFTQKTSSLVGHLRFVHAETVLPLLTLLGYVDKTPLSGTATASEIQKRTFRSSRLSPFMANLEFRLYQRNAENEVGQRASSQYFVQIRVNEQVTAVPGCGGKVFCALSEVENIWGYYLNEYDFQAKCAV